MIIQKTENSTITGCNITLDEDNVYAIYLQYESDQNTIIDSVITTTGSGAEAMRIDGSQNTNITNNTITTAGDGAYGIFIYLSSDSSTIVDNTITTSVGASADGIHIYYSNNAQIADNTIKATGPSSCGLFLSSDTDDNTIVDNTIQSSQTYGIYLEHISSYVPGNNTIYNNLINGSSTPVGFSATTNANTWNTTEQAGNRTYSSGNLIGGNYYTNSSGTGYSDTCADADHDGFCDSAYVLGTNNTDSLPLSDEYTSCSDGTYYWDTAEECVINTSRVCSNATIVMNCNVSISAAFNSSYVSWRWNSSADDQYQILVDAGGVWQSLNDSFQDYGASGHDSMITVNSGGWANLTNTVDCDVDLAEVIAYDGATLFIDNFYNNLRCQNNYWLFYSNANVTFQESYKDNIQLIVRQISRLVQISLSRLQQHPPAT